VKLQKSEKGETEKAVEKRKSGKGRKGKILLARKKRSKTLRGKRLLVMVI